MPKAKAKEEERPKPKPITEIYPKLYKDISDELVRLMDEIKYEIQWLEQHCKKVVTEPCESEWDLRSLAELKNKLEKMRNELRRNGYSLSSSSDYIRYLLGEISIEELDY
jgi:hypothetical protein